MLFRFHAKSCTNSSGRAKIQSGHLKKNEGMRGKISFFPLVQYGITSSSGPIHRQVRIIPSYALSRGSLNQVLGCLKAKNNIWMRLIDSMRNLSLIPMLFTAVISREGRLYVALAPDVDVASQGETIEEALANLKEALELYFEDDDTIDS